MRLQLDRAAFLAAACLAASFAPLVRAQSCDPAWLTPSPESGVPGTAMTVLSTAVFDIDGSGPEPAWLIVGGQGNTTASSAAGTTIVRSLAAWNGAQWTNIGNVEASSFIVGNINALHVHNGELIAAGSFSSIGGVPARNIAAWNGTSWRPLATGLGTTTSSAVRALATFNDELYAGGSFLTTGSGALVYNIARFDGSTWRSVGNGVATTATLGASVNALLNFGGELVIGGFFSNAGDIPAVNIARWNGTSYSGFAQGIGLNLIGNVVTLESFDGSLFAGGNIEGLPNSQGGTFSGLAQWTGSQWIRAAGNYNFGTIRAMRAYENSLYIATGISDQGELVRWAGTSAPPSLVLPAAPAGFSDVNCLDVYAGQLVVAGFIPAESANVYRGMGVVWFDGTSFGSFGRGFAGSITSIVPDGDGVFIAGSLQLAGGAPVRSMAHWDGAATWQNYPTLPSSTGSILDVTRFGSRIIVGGSFFTTAASINYISSWNGTNWTRLSSANPSGEVRALEVFQNDLYAGGTFQNIGVAVPNIARWNGIIWSPVGNGLNGSVNDLLVTESGLIATGTFSASGTTQLNRIGVWTGSDWQPLGAGLGSNATGTCLVTFGNNLIVAGSSFAAPLTPISRWNGSQWHAMPAAPGGATRLGVVRGNLFAVGNFASVNSISCQGFAQWNGTSWSVPNLGIAGTFGSLSSEVPTTIAELADGRGIVGGNFILAGGIVARGWAQFTAGGGPNGILSQPADFTACPNLGAQFSVVLQNPAAASYEWRRDGMPLRNSRGISGANSNIITIDGVLPSDAGLYQCRIITACGVLNSAEATLTVTAQPNCPRVCDDVDFNNDGSIFDPLDVESFLSVFSEGPCL